MAKTGRPKKYNDLVQFNLYIERSDLEVLRWVVEATNKKHNTSAYTMAIVSREIFSQQIERIKKSKDYQLQSIVNHGAVEIEDPEPVKSAEVPQELVEQEMNNFFKTKDDA